jgi:hypothetical protein
MKLFDNTELKLAILYCLEKTGMKNLWIEIKKITKNPSYFHFIYFICQIKKSKLYPEMKLQIRIHKTNAFYNMLFKHLIKYDYKIENGRLPLTNEKISKVIKRWNISKNLIKQFKKKYNLNKQKIILTEVIRKNYLFEYVSALLFISHLYIILLYFVSF